MNDVLEHLRWEIKEWHDRFLGLRGANISFDVRLRRLGYLGSLATCRCVFRRHAFVVRMTHSYRYKGMRMKRRLMEEDSSWGAGYTALAWR